MSASIFPLAMTEEARLVSGIVFGLLFGFSLERAGFGNARKLAAQFYGHDLTVFKVMFTAILVAMVGVYGLANFGLVDMSLVWINPTFMWAQVVGGFLLGAGFIMSGLCPGTSVVSAASGRWDAVVTIGGIFIGTAAFALAVDFVPGMDALYRAGDMGVSTLPAVFGMPPLVLALVVVVVAGTAFVAAEKIEARFQGRRPGIELAPRPRPRMKFATAGVLAAATLLGLGAVWLPDSQPSTPTIEAIAPLDLAERMIAGDPTLMIVDVRTDDTIEERIPGAYPAPDAEVLLGLLQNAPAGMQVVVYGAGHHTHYASAGWPPRLTYAYVEGGFEQWSAEVLVPAAPRSASLEDRERAARQNQIAAWFTGSVQAPSAAAPPPAMPAGGGAAKKKAGGC
jgi:hypothetical protein